MKKILITGAGGFIGGHLVKELLNRGYSTVDVEINKGPGASGTISYIKK